MVISYLNEYTHLLHIPLQCGDLGIPVSSEFPNCRQRDVVCLNEHNHIVDNDFCSHLPRPSSTYTLIEWHVTSYPACTYSVLKHDSLKEDIFNFFEPKRSVYKP